MSGGATVGTAGRALLVAAVVAVVATVVAALLVMDPPSMQRAERLDRIRIEHLQLLSQRIEMHARVHDALPADIGAVTEGPGDVVVDPASGEAYTYEPVGVDTYRLCATFATVDAPASPGMRDEWRHGSGRQCFDREVGDELRPGAPVPQRAH